MLSCKSSYFQGRLCNRVSSSLIGLGTRMCISPVCEKKALFAICQLMKEKNIESELVKQVSYVQALKGRGIYFMQIQMVSMLELMLISVTH